MHFPIILWIISLMAIGASALQPPQQQFLISFPQDTPQSELDSYRSMINSAGGEILHEWELIKGFIVKASTEALDTIKAFSDGENGVKPTIEEDEMMRTQD